ncbi:MAG: hypothetical protein WCO67_21175, partial [Betaproteobacteria bacterium]
MQTGIETIKDYRTGRVLLEPDNSCAGDTEKSCLWTALRRSLYARVQLPPFISGSPPMHKPPILSPKSALSPNLSLKRTVTKPSV